MELLRKARELGVGVVQICDNMPLDKMSLQELGELRAEADRLDIGIETGTRGVEPEHLLKYLKISNLLGARLLRTMIQYNNGRSEIGKAADSIKQVLGEFAGAGVSIAVENYELVRSSELVEIIKAVDSEYVGVCLDTVNSFGALECPQSVIHELAPFAINFHYKDFRISRADHKMGFHIYGCPAGDGMLDASYIRDTLRKHERNPNVILELWTPFCGDIQKTVEKEQDWAERSIRFLGEVFGNEKKR